MTVSSLLRNHKYSSQTIASGGNLSDAFDFRAYTMGLIHMPAAWTAASIGFKVCNTAGGTYLPLYDKNGSLVQITSPAASKAYALPAELAGAHFVKLWSQDGTGSNSNQAAARTLVVDLKA
jgi:hypothetical protein